MHRVGQDICPPTIIRDIGVKWGNIGLLEKSMKKYFLGFKDIAPALENHMEKNMESQKETAIYRGSIGFRKF